MKKLVLLLALACVALARSQEAGAPALRQAQHR